MAQEQFSFSPPMFPSTQLGEKKLLSGEQTPCLGRLEIDQKSYRDDAVGFFEGLQKQVKAVFAGNVLSTSPFREDLPVDQRNLHLVPRGDPFISIASPQCLLFPTQSSCTEHSFLFFRGTFFLSPPPPPLPPPTALLVACQFELQTTVILSTQLKILVVS